MKKRLPRPFAFLAKGWETKIAGYSILVPDLASEGSECVKARSATLWQFHNDYTRCLRAPSFSSAAAENGWETTIAGYSILDSDLARPNYLLVWPETAWIFERARIHPCQSSPIDGPASAAEGWFSSVSLVFRRTHNMQIRSIEGSEEVKARSATFTLSLFLIDPRPSSVRDRVTTPAQQPPSRVQQPYDAETLHFRFLPGWQAAACSVPRSSCTQ
jgi:hypothetical protein